MRRWIFLSAITVTAAALLPAPITARTKNTTEFLSGTVKGIPQNTPGSLDTSDSKELRFLYGKAMFAVKYESITNAQIAEPPGKHLLHVPVPRIGKGPRYLTITYRDGEKPLVMTFRAPASEVSNVVSTIEERRKGPQSAAKTSGKSDQDWWGDRYWRTTRNKAKWPTAEPTDGPGVPAGTKY